MKVKPILRTIYENLNSGKEYGYSCDWVTYPYFNTVLSANTQYIYWQHFGSSANKNKISELKWIIEVIFKMSPEEFISKYECR